MYVQRDERNTESLYRNATKYNFHSDLLMKASKLTDVFKTEEKLLNKSRHVPGDVSKGRMGPSIQSGHSLIDMSYDNILDAL